MTQRTLLALRQLAPRRAIPVVGYRMGSTTAGKPKAKLVFRFSPKDVPIELWPMGAVVCAGIVGAGIAISRHFAKDEDLRLHRNVHNVK